MNKTLTFEPQTPEQIKKDKEMYESFLKFKSFDNEQLLHHYTETCMMTAFYYVQDKEQLFKWATLSGDMQTELRKRLGK